MTRSLPVTKPDPDQVCDHSVPRVSHDSSRSPTARGFASSTSKAERLRN